MSCLTPPSAHWPIQGRHTTQGGRRAAPSRFMPAFCSTSSRRTACRVSCSYNFAEAGDDEELKFGRRNKTVDKRAAAQVLSVVRGLVGMTPKQLAAVSHLLDERQLDAVTLAGRIAPTNQGRKRQEALAAKLLRDGLEEGELATLAEAVRLSKEEHNTFIDAELEGVVETWLEGLLGGDGGVEADVAAAALAGGLETQPLRQLIRSAQHEQVELRAARAAARDAAAANGDDELTRSAATGKPARSSAKARRQLRKAIKALAAGALHVRKGSGSSSEGGVEKND